MAEVTLKCGFTAEIAEDAKDNWELLEALREIDKGNVGAIVDVAPMLLGAEQFKALREHLRQDGKVKASDMVAAVYEIMEKDKESKN